MARKLSLKQNLGKVFKRLTLKSYLILLFIFIFGLFGRIMTNGIFNDGIKEMLVGVIIVYYLILFSAGLHYLNKSLKTNGSDSRYKNPRNKRG